MEKGDKDLIDPRDIEKLNEEQRGEQPSEEGNQRAQYPFESDSDSEDEGEQEQNVEHEEENAEVMNKKVKSKEKTKPVSKPDPPPKVHHKNQKTLPFPRRKKNMSDEELYKSFVDALHNLTFEVPILKAMQVSTYKKFLRDILSRKEPFFRLKQWLW